jgi:hypothetical protein
MASVVTLERPILTGHFDGESRPTMTGHRQTFIHQQNTIDIRSRTFSMRCDAMRDALVSLQIELNQGRFVHHIIQFI